MWANMKAQFVLDGVSGLLAASPAGWLEALELLADDPGLRTSMARELRVRLDAAYQREQLLLEVLLDIRDGREQAPEAPPPSQTAHGGGVRGAVDTLQSLHKLTKLKG